MVKKYLLIGFVILLIVGIFAVTYSLGDTKYKIDESYAKGGDVRGWINMSFDDEDANSEFKYYFDNIFQNSIKLIDLLEKDDIRHNYTCDPNSCESFYSIDSSGTDTKTFTLNAGEKLIGFKLNSDMSSIKNFSLTINSTALSNFTNQLKIDLFNDGTYILGNTKIGGGESNKNYGCFYLGEETIGEIPLNGMFCQRMNLPESPGFTLGAWVKNETGFLNLSIGLYDIQTGIFLDEAACYLPNPINIWGPISCGINYLITEKADYYVCLYESNENYGGGNYKIKAYPDVNGCGFKGDPYGNPNEVGAYRIFAKSKSFGDFEELKITNQIPNGEFISDLISDYLYEKYGGLDCAENGCIIPIKLISSVTQEITIKDLKLDVEIPGFATFTETSIYDISEDSALISADFQKIYLDKANFTVPNTEGNYNFTLKFKNNNLFTQEVEVKKGVSILSISPVKTAKGLPTIFRVRLDIPENITITEYKWDFGDGTTIQTTQINEAIHTYNNLTTYSITITVEDSEGTISSRIFNNIEVRSASEVLDSIINETFDSIGRIEQSLSTYDAFSKIAIKKILGLDDIKQKLNNISSNYISLGQGASESEYQALLSQLLGIELPRSISQTLSSAPLFFPMKKENIDLDVIADIAGANGDYSNLYDEYQDAVLGWNIDNMETKVSIKEFSANYGFGEEMLVKVFKVNIKDLAQETPYLFIEDMENLEFKNNLTEDSGYYYKDLSGNEIVEFYTTQNIEFENLPLFISPSLLLLSVVAGGEPEKAGKEFNWILFIIIIIFVILIGIGIYFFLKKWYEEKYENYLFKNKNDLYNMVTYIQNAKQQGKDDNSIAKDLRKAKWNNEQISYVMKKYAGKKTGMPSFPKKPVSQQKIGNSPIKRP